MPLSVFQLKGLPPWSAIKEWLEAHEALARDMDALTQFADYMKRRQGAYLDTDVQTGRRQDAVLNVRRNLVKGSV